MLQWILGLFYAIYSSPKATYCIYASQILKLSQYSTLLTVSTMLCDVDCVTSHERKAIGEALNVITAHGAHLLSLSPKVALRLIVYIGSVRVDG